MAKDKNYNKIFNSAERACTLEECASALGLTKERVRQIEASALKKLRHPKVGRKLREYLQD